ncbi:PadR family transcriptional regulator [Halorubrum sp. BOL3-1]|uniref:helix-turn-helix transcriptional regulator n=1 Tax=Halorubrum sp. BOL3-1 TaxID=2497325 RepID=UPI001004E93E|nr:helix-turn-helix transcriptional regulator [Halorubrum sp. BOL3-1]QAU13463.1 PadR family transcriptional regulator [Halorubrum sp. BOL3-1]
MDEMTAFQRDILYVVAGRDKPHGLAIKSALEDYYNSGVNHGRLYPNLDELADEGLLSKGKYDKRTNMYALTEDGEATIKSRQQWEQQKLSDGVVVSD